MADFNFDDLMDGAASLPKENLSSVLRFLADQNQEEIMLVLSREAALDLADRLDKVPAHHGNPVH